MLVNKENVLRFNLRKLFNIRESLSLYMKGRIVYLEELCQSSYY